MEDVREHYSTLRDTHFRLESEREAFMRECFFKNAQELHLKPREDVVNTVVVTSRQLEKLLEWRKGTYTILDMYPLLCSFVARLQVAYGFQFKYLQDEEALELFINAAYTE